MNTMVDMKSELPFPHLSYILKYLIRLKDILELPVKELKYTFKHKGMECKFIGSAVEGLCVSLFSLKSIKSLNVSSQIPIIVGITPGVTVGSVRQPQSMLCCRWDTSRTHPGYLHLCPFFDDILPEYSFIWLDSNTRILKHGKGECGGNVDVSGKMYIGFNCESWPEVARHTILNLQKYHWPGKKIIEALLETRCFVINRPHPKSSYPDAEWQFMFSDAEVILMNKALTADQKYLFKVFKILVDFHLRLSPIHLKTTHLKSVFYRTCIDVSVTNWPENFGRIFIILLEQLSMDIKMRNIPNFFIPENNMIDHFSQEDFILLDEKMSGIRQFPMMALSYLADHYALERCWMIDSIVGDVGEFLKNGNLLQSIEKVFVPTTIEIAKICMEKHQYKDASTFLHEAFTDMKSGYATETKQPRNTILTFHEFVFNVLQSEKSDIQQNMACQVGEDYGTSLMSELNTGKTGITLKDLIGDKAGAFANRPITDEEVISTEKLIKYLDWLAFELALQNRMEEAKTFLNCGIDIAKKAKASETIETKEIDDIALKRDIDRQVKIRHCTIDLHTLELYSHLHFCNVAQGIPEVCVEYVEDFMDLCDRWPSYGYYSMAISMWKCLNNQEKVKECQLKMNALPQHSDSNKYSTITKLLRIPFEQK